VITIINYPLLPNYTQTLILLFEFASQVLQSHVDQNQNLSGLINDCNVKSYVDSNASATLIKEFVAKLVQLKG